MSHVSRKFGIFIDRAIGCPGHGKCEVNAINGVGKDIIYRKSMKELPDPNDAFKSSSSSL